MSLAKNALINESHKPIAFLEVVNFTISINFSTDKFVAPSPYRKNNAIWDLLASFELWSARTVTSPIAKISFIRFSLRNSPKTLKYSSTDFNVHKSHLSEHLTDA